MNEGLDCHLDLQIMRTACGGPETAKDVTGEGTPSFPQISPPHYPNDSPGDYPEVLGAELSPIASP